MKKAPRMQRAVPVSLALAALFAFASLSTLPNPANAAALDDKSTPEQVADLSIRTFVNRDMDAAAQLNDYLKPAFSGGEAFSMAELRKFAADKPREDEANAKRIAADAPAAQRATLQRAFLAYFQGMDRAVAGARCRATGSSLAPNETALRYDPKATQAKVAKVRYQCDIPATDPAVEKAIAQAVAAQDGKKLLDATTRFKAAMTQPVQWKTVTGAAALYRDLGLPGDRWNTGSPEDWTTAILEGLPSLEPRR